MSKRVLIVGGGAAGWLAALYCKKIDPSLNVELIESEKIGIVGAGESTSSYLAKALNALGIDVREFIKETNATIKAGTKFDDWDFPGSSYFSLFTPWFYNEDGSLLGSISPNLNREQISDYLLYCYANDIDINKSGVHKFALEKKSPIVKIGNGPNATYIPTQGLTYHIDAKLTAKFLRKKAEAQGVIRHEGEIVKITGHNPITSLEDNRGKVYEIDFVFDCSGFARLIIDKHFKTKWIDCSKYLTVDSTIPFFLLMDEKIPTYTQATAMKYGWMFKVPVKNRYGSGYIYDSNYITKEQAIQEVEEKLGQTIELVNFFKFKTGFFEEIFVNNCIALGLSSNFLEPMAATNLTLVILTLYKLERGSEMGAFKFDNENTQNHFRVELNNSNKIWIESSAICEIFSHYVNNRNDTEFWKQYKNIENYPPVFRKAYEDSFVKEDFNFNKFAEITRFAPEVFITKLIGNNWFKDRAKRYCEQNNIGDRYCSRIHRDIIKYTNFINPYLLDHKDYLNQVHG